VASDADADEATARITLRLPEGLKQRAEVAATTARQSLNTWLVDAGARRRPTGRRRAALAPARRVGKQLSGWVR
jgi:hypothetical protein